MFFKNMSLRGFSLYAYFTRASEALNEMIPWTASGKLKVDVETFALSSAADAHRAVEERKTNGKVVLVPKGAIFEFDFCRSQATPRSKPRLAWISYP